MRGALGKFRMRVEAGADRRAADRKIVEPIERDRDARAVAIELRNPAGKFLADGERRRVLQMRAADFDDVREFCRLGLNRIADFAHCRQQDARGFGRGGDVHRGGKRVVGRLRHIYVVIGVNGLLAAHFAAGDFDGAIRDHLVDVHVGLRAAAGLVDAQRKMVVELAGDDFVGGLRDERGLFGRKLAEILIYERGGFLEDAEGANELGRHGVFADVEVNERAGGLRAVVAVGGDFDLAHRVGFSAGRAGVDDGNVGHEKLLGCECSAKFSRKDNAEAPSCRRLAERASSILGRSRGTPPMFSQECGGA